MRILAAIVLTVLALCGASPASAAAQTDPAARIKEGQALIAKRATADALKVLEPLLTDPAVTSDPALLADALYRTGYAYFQLAEYPTALKHYARGREVSRALPLRTTTAQLEYATAQVYKNQGSYAKSLDHATEALTLYQTLNDRSNIAIVWVLIGAVQDLTGRHHEALASYEKAVPILQDASPLVYHRVLNEIGITLKNLGDYRRALEHYERALEGQIKIADRYGQATTLNNIGVAYNLLGQDDRSIEAFQRALVMAREIKERRGESILLGNLGDGFLDRGDHTRAIEYLEQQLRLTRELGNRNEEANAHRNLGDAYVLRGDYEAARRSYDTALTIQREIGALRREGRTVLALARLSLKQGDATEGERLARQALTLAKETPEFEWEARLVVARAVRALGRTAEAVEELRLSAKIINDLRANVASDAAKIAFVDTRQEVYRELASALVAAGRPEDALEAAEAGRARAFADLLEQRHVRGKPAEQELLSAVRSAIGDARSGRSGAAEASPSVTTPSATSATRSAGALDETLAKLRADNRELASLLTAESPTRTEIVEIAKRLDATIVEYLVTDRELVAWVVSPSGDIRATTMRIDRQRLDRLITDVRTPIDTLDQAGLARPNALRVPLRELDRLLIAPLATWLPSSADALVVVIPHGPLALLPFAALEDTRGTPLLARHTLVFAPAVSVYRYTPGKRRAGGDRGSALIVADPDPPAGSGIDRLPGARDEAQQVAKRLGNGDVELWTGPRASEASVKRRAAAHGILHFATHGLISAERPLASSLLLAAGEGEDGYLRVDEIFSLPLTANLVVLSGCSTGLGRLSGDGIIGLSRAFIYAGTPAVMVSQWDVSDRATAYLMDRFYAGLRDGHGAASALRAAQLATRRRFAHPALWAAFSLVGEPR